MPASAVLSLHIARFLQTPIEAPCSPARWTFLPGPRRVTFAEACDALDALPKPVIFAPLGAPGFVSIVNLTQLPGAQATEFSWHVRNQADNLPRFLAQAEARDSDVVAFGRVDDYIETTVAALREWTRDYLVLPAPAGIHRDPAQPNRHWLTLRRPDGSWSHGAWCGIPEQRST